jgi:hypothetical protein
MSAQILVLPQAAHPYPGVKKVGGALIEKQHIDMHCDRLANLYERIAKEDEALAKAHKAMAKEVK